jgi:hypothetical protein
MQKIGIEIPPPSVFFVEEAEFEFFEPKRLVISPLELCLLSKPDDLFEDD